MIWKTYAKKCQLLNWINARLKCFQLKRGLARLTREYGRKSAITGFQYNAAQAVEEFKRRHRQRCPHFTPPARGQLHIFWVGTTQSQDESGFLQALCRVAKVTVFHNINGKYGIWTGESNTGEVPSFDDIRRANDECLLSQIKQANASDGINLLLGQMWANLTSKEALQEVQCMGIPVVNIAMDDRLPGHWEDRDGLRLGSVGLGPGVDMVLTTSADTCLWYGLESCPAVFWPLASDPEIFAPDDNSAHDIDVLFIGNRYGIRAKIVSRLERRGIKVDCYGGGWPNGYVNAEQMADLSKRARIILGVGTVGHCSDVYTMKLRDFDALMTGALYVTHRNPDLCRLYTEGEEIECYESPEEAFGKIRYYLDHPAEREMIGNRGRRKAIARDTWDDRLSSTLCQLGLLQDRSAGGQTVDGKEVQR